MEATIPKGRRVLVTQATTFVGPALCEVLAGRGADVVANDERLDDPAAAERIVAAVGAVDVLLVNLGIPAASTPAAEVGDAEWREAFAAMVDPLPRLARAVLPQMIARRSGKIVVLGSAAALRGQNRTSSYSAARGAQLAWAQAVGVEVARHGVQVNALAFNFVDTPTYFPPEVKANPRFQERLRREVPLGRLVGAHEAAEFAAYLCSPAADCFVGQVFPVCGGWTAR
jgi:NAD(P)-dependent dehydrogenase (short-subunit alcohol dehydrogenase family)